MRYKILFFIFIFNLSAFAVDNYSVGGKIINSESQEGVSAINVLLQNASGVNIRGAISGDNGNFELLNIKPGSYTFLAFGLGYEQIEQTLTVNENLSGLHIPLKETAFNLDQVVITATRSERFLKDVPIATQIISGKTVEQMQHSGLRNILEYEMPGVEFTNNGGYANINMLGFGGKYVLFLIDGERMAGESFDNIDYERIEKNNIERIEIVKGASSSLYGSNAIGGVINIITGKPQKPLELQADVRYGSNAEQQYNLLTGSKQKWGYFSVAGTYKAIDPYLLKDTKPLTQEYESGEIIEQALGETYIAGYTIYNIKPRIMFNIGEKTELELKGGYFFKERNPGGRDGQKVRDRFYDYTGGVKIDHNLSEKQHLSATFNYDRYEKYDFYKLLNEKEKNYENEQFRASVIYNLSIKEKHFIVAGGEFMSDKLISYMFDEEGENDKRDAQTYAMFTQQEWLLHPNITLVTGLRFDYHSRFKGHITPRLSLMYKFNPKISLRGGYAGGFRSPTLKELYTDWFHPYGGGFQIIGNKEMKAETSNNFNLSTDISLGKTHITAMAQYSIIDKKVSSVWLNQDTIQYVNLGDANVFSSEINVTHRFNKSLTVKAGYAFVHDDLGKASIVRPHSATLRLSYTTTFLPKYNPTFNFSGKHFSGMDIYGTGDVSEIENSTGVSKDTKQYKVHYDGYSIWRLTLYSPLPFGFSLNAGIDNLFDYKPAFSSFYSSISPGRTFYIGLKWTLK